jgi:hypothetical protein
MLYYTLVFLLIALVAGALGFGLWLLPQLRLPESVSSSSSCSSWLAS